MHTSLGSTQVLAALRAFFFAPGGIRPDGFVIKVSIADLGFHR